MEPATIKKALISSIDSVSKRIKKYSYNPSSDFTRKRKIFADSIIKGLLGMEAKSLSNELIDMFDSNTNIPTASAFIQQRNKLKPEAGSIHITGTRDKDHIYLIIKDDGVGIPEDLLETILQKNVKKKKHGYGIWNIHERLQLSYGEAFGLRFESILGEGTIVTVTLPYLEQI